MKTESAVELVVVVKVLVPKSVKVATVATVKAVVVAIAVVFELATALVVAVGCAGQSVVSVAVDPFQRPGRIEVKFDFSIHAGKSLLTKLAVARSKVPRSLLHPHQLGVAVVVVAVEVTVVATVLVVVAIVLATETVVVTGTSAAIVQTVRVVVADVVVVQPTPAVAVEVIVVPMLVANTAPAVLVLVVLETVLDVVLDVELSDVENVKVLVPFPVETVVFTLDVNHVVPKVVWKVTELPPVRKRVRPVNCVIRSEVIRVEGAITPKAFVTVPGAEKVATKTNSAPSEE